MAYKTKQWRLPDMSFSGFSDKALRFLLENRMNNSKQWYDSHKDEYKKYVYNPFVELVNELAPAVLQIDSQIITVPSKIISRVRRDTRFTKDKTLYRDNVWIVFCVINPACLHLPASGSKLIKPVQATASVTITRHRRLWLLCAADNGKASCVFIGAEML
jgi:hypothetical protein